MAQNNVPDGSVRRSGKTCGKKAEEEDRETAGSAKSFHGFVETDPENARRKSGVHYADNPPLSSTESKKKSV
jgi:hypothetical protein